MMINQIWLHIEKKILYNRIDKNIKKKLFLLKSIVIIVKW